MRANLRYRSWSADLPTQARLVSDYYGTPGNDHLQGSTGSDYIDVSQGGDDRVAGLSGDDTVFFGGAFTKADRVDGGGGYDVVTLDGDYSMGIRFSSQSLVNIDELELTGGSFVIRGELGFMDDFGWTVIEAPTLMAGQNLDVSVASSGVLVVDGGAGNDIVHAPLSGARAIFDGAGGDDLLMGGASGNDNLSGGDGNDSLIGGGGFTKLFGGAGADTIEMHSSYNLVGFFSTSESTPEVYDTIKNFAGIIELAFDSNEDKSGIQHKFHIREHPHKANSIGIHYDAANDQTIIDVFTNTDTTPDFTVHLTGDVHLTMSNFTFG